MQVVQISQNGKQCPCRRSGEEAAAQAGDEGQMNGFLAAGISRSDAVRPDRVLRLFAQTGFVCRYFAKGKMRIRKWIWILLVAVLAVCSQIPSAGPIENSAESAKKGKEDVMSRNGIKIEAGDRSFTARPAENQAARELMEQLAQGPIELSLDEYGVMNTAVLKRPDRLAEAVRTEAKPGDLMLYEGARISVFYGSNTWAYTALGHVSDLTGWKEALGSGNVHLVLSVEQE